MLPALLAGLFLVLGLCIVPLVGLQNDEVLFAAGIYAPTATKFAIKTTDREYPIMLMSYLGATKMWLYRYLFRAWKPSVYSVRVPVLLCGAATVWLLFLWAQSSFGRPAAWFASALLTTDATFILTTCLDWGPVALQHLLALAGVWCLWRFYNRRGLWHVFAGWFLFGLALWDKAVFIWLLGGLGLATLLVFPRQLFRLLSWRAAACAIVGFLLGAAPLGYYNLEEGWKTFSGNTRLSAEGISQKLLVARKSLEGGALFGYIVRDNPDGHSREPRGAVEHASVALSQAAGSPRAGLLATALVLSLLLLPFTRAGTYRKGLLWVLITGGITHLQMLFTAGAGEGTHHVALLWPLPHLFVAATVAGVAQRSRKLGAGLLVAGAVVLCTANALLLNEYLARAIRHGPTTIWTDAASPLARFLEESRPEAVFVNDWGIFNVLRVLGRGRLPLLLGSDPFMDDDISPDDQRLIDLMFSSPRYVFVTHTEGNEVFTGVDARFTRAAAARGLRKNLLAVIRDSHQRPIFQVFRLEAL